MEDDKTFPELLFEAGFRNTGKITWKLNYHDMTIRFIGRGQFPLDYVPKVDGYNDRELATVWFSLCSIEEFLDWLDKSSQISF